MFFCLHTLQLDAIPHQEYLFNHFKIKRITTLKNNMDLRSSIKVFNQHSASKEDMKLPAKIYYYICMVTGRVLVLTRYDL